MRIRIILLAIALAGSVAFAPAGSSSSADQAQDQGTALRHANSANNQQVVVRFSGDDEHARAEVRP